MSSPGGEPAWKQRAVERSTKAATLRAQERVERLLDAAQLIIAEQGSTDFTVQQVVDRSRQSLRSFYNHFDGKHELLLALFEEALRRAADQIQAAASVPTAPLDRLKVAVQLLFELSRPDPSALRPLFTDFGPQLRATHPTEVRAATAPLLQLLTDLMEQAAAEGHLRPRLNPRRLAVLTMETVVFTAYASGARGDQTAHPITAEEVWDFCSQGFARPTA